MTHAYEIARRSRARAARTCAVGMLVAIQLANGWVRSPPRTPRPFAIDIQHAPAWQLALLPGVGRMRSHQIVRLRRRIAICGPIDLERLPGFGSRSADRLRRCRELRIRWAAAARER